MALHRSPILASHLPVGFFLALAEQRIAGCSAEVAAINHPAVTCSRIAGSGRGPLGYAGAIGPRLARMRARSEIKRRRLLANWIAVDYCPARLGWCRGAVDEPTFLVEVARAAGGSYCAKLSRQL